MFTYKYNTITKHKTNDDDDHSGGDIFVISKTQFIVI